MDVSNAYADHAARNSPPANSVQPDRSHAPLSGTNGTKLARSTSPVTSGTTPMISSGTSTASPMIVCTRAARRIPPCCRTNTSSRNSAATTYCALTCRPIPSFRKSSGTSVTDHVLITASGGNRAVSTYPAARLDPIMRTGDQASQLHHTDTGATNFE